MFLFHHTLSNMPFYLPMLVATLCALFGLLATEIASEFERDLKAIPEKIVPENHDETTEKITKLEGVIKQLKQDLDLTKAELNTSFEVNQNLIDENEQLKVDHKLTKADLNISLEVKQNLTDEKTSVIEKIKQKDQTMSDIQKARELCRKFSDAQVASQVTIRDLKP